MQASPHRAGSNSVGQHYAWRKPSGTRNESIWNERDAEKVNQRRNVEIKMLFCKVQGKLENKSNVPYFHFTNAILPEVGRKNDIQTKGGDPSLS